MSSSDDDDELMKEFVQQHQASKYGADTKEGVQQCLECRDLRKVYCEPFLKCHNEHCTRYICDTCFPTQGKFCDICHTCGACCKLLNCHNCGVYRCEKKDNYCEIRKCLGCGVEECLECDSGGECRNCGEEWP